MQHISIAIPSLELLVLVEWSIDSNFITRDFYFCSIAVFTMLYNGDHRSKINSVTSSFSTFLFKGTHCNCSFHVSFPSCRSTSDAVIFLFLGLEVVHTYHEWNSEFVFWSLFLCLLCRAISKFITKARMVIIILHFSSVSGSLIW